MSKLVKAGRLAYRVEGKFWNLYWAPIGTMKGATLLASCRLDMAAPHRDAHIAFMRGIVSDWIEANVGYRPEWPEPPTPAPEHERSGNA